jgi:FSR family fosmidomycin resistance protein-like MFS transporter
MTEERVDTARGFQGDVLGYLGAAHFVNDMLTGSLTGILPFVQAAFGLSFAGLGLMVTLSNLTSSMIQPVFGFVGDRRPLYWILPLAPAFAAAGLVALGHAPTAGAAFACVLLLGLGSAVFHPEGARAAHLAAGARRGFAQAIFQVGGNLGFAFGPLLASLLLGGGASLARLDWTLVPAIAIVGVGLALRGRLRANSRQATAHRPDARRASSRTDRKAGLSGIMVALLGVITLRSFVQLGVAAFLPLDFVHVLHQSAAAGDRMSFLFLAAGAVGTYVGGWLSDRSGAVTLVRWSMGAAVPLMAVLPSLGGALFVVDLVVLGFVVLSTFAVTVTLGQAYLPGAVGVSSGLTIGLSVGAGGVGTALMGWAADRVGIPGVLHALWVLPAAAFALALLLRPVRADPVDALTG